MKRSIMCLGFLVSIALPSLLFGQNFRVAYIDYMYVPEDMHTGYVVMEQEIAKPIHQEAINQGKLYSWSLWSISVPGGTDAEYHYATIRIYDEPAQLSTLNEFDDLIPIVHPDKNMEDIQSYIWDTRDMVKTHRLISWERFTRDGLNGPPSVMQVVYMNVPEGGDDIYQQMERAFFLPLHKKEVELNKRAGWEAWELNQPYGSTVDYTHITMDMYDSLGQYFMDNDAEAILREVHPNIDEKFLQHIVNNTREMVRFEQWDLIDFVQKGVSN